MHTTVAGDTLPATGDHCPIGPGTSIGRYRIERRIGAGGMGVVYVAFDPELERNVAVKLLRDRGDAGTADRLRREARALAALSHPNVVAVHDVGEYASQLFIAMEYVDGGSLRDWLAGGRRPWRDVLRLAIAAGRGVEAAHAAGLVHRDIKPDNLLVGRDGRVRVTDFGIVATANRPRDTDPQLTIPGAIVGTPAYMPPEQLTGTADARSDQFSLCATAFEALFGVRPYAGDTIEAIVSAIVSGAIVETRRHVPRWLRASIVRGLAADPAQRWPSIGALCDELERRQHRSRRWWIASGVAAAAIAGSAVGWLVLPSSGPLVVLPPTCEVPKVPETVWSPTRAAKLAQILPPGVIPRIDGWLTKWAFVATDICVTDARDVELQNRRRDCLADELERFNGQLGRWNAGENLKPTILAEAAFVALPAPWRCSHLAQLTARPKPTAAQVPRIDEARREFVIAQINLMSDPPSARTKLEGILDGVRAIGYAPFTFEVLLTLADTELQTRHAPSAEKHLREALDIAEAAHDDVAIADATVLLVGALRGHDAREALAAAERASELIHRFGASDLESKLDGNVGAVWMENERPSEAMAAFHHGVASCRDAYGAASLCEGLLDLQLMAALQKTGAAEANIRAVQADAKRIYTLLGIPGSPPTAADLEQDPQQAIAGLKELLETAQHLRPNSLTVANGEAALAAAYSLADQNEAAYEHYSRAAELRDQLGARDSDMALALVQAAVALAELGRPRDALTIAKRAVEIARQARSEMQLAHALLVVGRTEIESGAPSAAREPLREALALYDKLRAEGAFRSRARFLLARALWDSASDKRAAIDLARAARIDLRAALDAPAVGTVRDHQLKRLDEIDRWLREHARQ